MTDSGHVTVHARDWFDGQKARYERVPQAVVRELIQNACDAILRAGLGDGAAIQVRIEGSRVIVVDPGIGFDAGSLQHLAVVRASGTRQARDEGRHARREDGFDIEGQFGVGFYATAMCADRVVVRTRSRRVDEAWQWTFLPADFSFERRSLPPESLPHGTQVEVHVTREWQRQFLDPQALGRLTREVCDFIPFPILIGDDARPVNTMVPPWDREDASQAACESFLRERGLLSDDDEVLFLSYLPWRQDVGLGGVLYVPKWSALAPAIDLHVNRYAIARSADLLPDALPFVHGVVVAREVDVNESRERVSMNEAAERLRGRLLAWALTGDPSWSPGVEAEGAGLGGLAQALHHPTPATEDLLFGNGRQLLRAAAATRPVRCAIGLDLPLPMLFGGERTLRQLRQQMVDEAVAFVRDPDHRAAATAYAREQRVSVVDGTTKPVEAFLRAAAGEWGIALREETGDSTAPSDAAAWRAALDLLRRNERYVADARCAALGRSGALTLDFSAVRKLPEFRFLDDTGGDWQDIVRFLSVPEASIADASRRTWLQLMESVWKARWPVVLNTDHALAVSLRHLADAAPRRAEALADTLLHRALIDTGIAWSADLRRKLETELDGALGRLVDTDDIPT